MCDSLTDSLGPQRSCKVASAANNRQCCGGFLDTQLCCREHWHADSSPGQKCIITLLGDIAVYSFQPELDMKGSPLIFTVNMQWHYHVTYAIGEGLIGINFHFSKLSKVVVSSRHFVRLHNPLDFCYTFCYFLLCRDFTKIKNRCFISFIYLSMCVSAS